MINEFEVWKPIERLEGKYQISSFGRMKSMIRRGVPEEVMLKIYADIRGTRHCRMTLHNKQTQFNIRKLVWEHFSDDNEVIMASRILYKNKDIDYPDRIDNLHIKPLKPKKEKKEKTIYDVERMMKLLMTKHNNSDKNTGINNNNKPSLFRNIIGGVFNKINVIGEISKLGVGIQQENHIKKQIKKLINDGISMAFNSLKMEIKKVIDENYLQPIKINEEIILNLKKEKEIGEKKSIEIRGKINKDITILKTI